jgi:membrane-associated phospholipid phosphatase
MTSTAITILVLLAITATSAVMYVAARYALNLYIRLSGRLPARWAELSVSIYLVRLVPRLSASCPRLQRLLKNRSRSQLSAGLALILMSLCALYLAGLFTGLVAEVVEAEGVAKFDDWINAMVEPLRTSAVVSISLWISALGDSPAVVSAVIIATGFLWAQRRFHVIGPLWIANLGAQATTWSGKYFVGRDRPPLPVDITAFSPSFPSGHATAAMAVYGFLAYAIARDLPVIRERFEIAYWIAVLIGSIGLSRLALGVHYVTDVVGGFLVGGFWLLVGFVIAEWTRPVSDS